MTRERLASRRPGWIIVIVILAVLAAIVGWRIVRENIKQSGSGSVTPTTQPET